MITFVQIIHMATHNITGKEGEAFARHYLEDKGYRILHCNWRYRHKELDIVASDGKELVVVEVKTRSDNYLVSPLESVDAAKIKCIVSAADVYARKFNVDLSIRFDIIAVVKYADGYRAEHIEDAFYAPLRK